MNYKTYYKTVGVLIDELPDFDKAEAERLCRFLSDNGYNALPVDCATVADQTVFRGYANTLIIPQCASTPAELMKPLEDLVGRGGNLICLGGPIFYDNIVKDGDKYVKKTMPEQILDATFLPENHGIVIEGFAPSYKVYRFKASRIEGTEAFGSADYLAQDGDFDLICPIPRCHGGGHFERRERFIPLARGEEYNTAAFVMLNKGPFGGHDNTHPRPGYVVPTTHCRATAGIGIKRADILSVKGADRLILSLLERMIEGLWLFEAGVNTFRPKHGESLKLGCSVMNSSFDYKSVEVEFSIGGDVKLTKKLIAAPRVTTSFEVDVSADALFAADCELICTLKLDGEPIDEIGQEIKFKPEIDAVPEDFVRVKDGEFTLNGKHWQFVGMNYWPSYHPSFEVVNYWCGWLDTVTYDPITIERDICRMEKLGINCVLTRIDTLELAKGKAPISDFIERLRAHDMKLILSIPMMESPMNYHPDAFRDFVEQTELVGEPVLMAHDITWEVGMHIIYKFRDSFLPEFTAWCERYYGSIEAAIADWGIDVPIVDGLLTAPTDRQFCSDGEHRVYVAAFRRFIDEHVGRIWQDTVDDMRSVDPTHLYTYRQGMFNAYDCAYSATHTATDFVCPEGYHIHDSEEGYANACFSTEYLRTVSGGQPVVWAEYGRSLCANIWSKLIWDHEGFGFYDSELDKQSSYLAMFHRMMRKVHPEGSAPWWWCGGFRRTEMSDCGYCAPSGELRPCAVEYGKVASEMLATKRPTPSAYHTVDRDSDARGNHEICFYSGVKAWLEAEKNGDYLGVKLDGDGSDTENLPPVAVGNTVYDGKKPHKYMGSLFKAIDVTDSGAKIEFFNTQIAKWCASNTYVKVKSASGETLVPIEADTAYMKVAAAKLDKLPEGECTLVMYTDKVGEFGDIARIN